MDPTAQALFDEAVEHYRHERFQEAVDLLKRGLELEKNAWQMRFYLAMAYARQNKTREAKQEFMTMWDFCPDQELRRRAGAAITAMGTPQ